jgi:signal recognition particle receptor subunit beta
MLIDWANKTIQTKIVYYGPAMSGKTTSIRSLFSQNSQADKLESIETTTGRTLFFDYGALDVKRGAWTLRVFVWSATGQDYYAETRSTVLAGTDGVIFVADSQPHLLEDNIRSFRELESYFGDKLGETPALIIAINKFDLPVTISREQLLKGLGLHNGVQVFSTIAPSGWNIDDAFSAIVKGILNRRSR